jgi:glycosyltransferase involved in cell wall biosynthesis
MNYLVSIGIPTYNRPEGLKKTLELITNQTYKNLQIIISDNCSLDSKVKVIVESFMKNDDRITFFQQEENKGPAYNFEFVLKKATGKYFMWATDDDLWANDFVEKLVLNFDSYPNSITSFCNIKEINQNNEVINFFTYSNQLSSLNLFNRIKAWAKMIDLYFGKSSLIYGLHSTNVIKEIYFTSDQNYYGADNIIILDILMRGGIAINNEFLYGCVTNNVKYYGDELGNNYKVNDTLFKKIKKGIKFNKKRNDYFNLYIKKISDSNLKSVQILALTFIIRRIQIKLFLKDCFALFIYLAKWLLNLNKNKKHA